MATDVERLVVSLEASITKFDRAMAKASGAADTSARKIERRFASMNDRMGTSFAALSRGVAGAFAGAAALRGAQQLIDASTRIENSLKVTGLAGDDLTKVYDKLFASAQRNAAPLESLVTLYGRAAIVQKELGVTTEELLGFTDNVAVALRVAGTDAQTASGALLQLSQALGSGTVRAEEFNSILEGALPIAQAAAAGLEEAGGSVAKLRGLVVEGKVSSEAFFRAFEVGSVVLQEKVAGSELTVSQAFVRLQNVLIDAVGQFDQTSGAGQRFANFLGTLGDKINEIANSPEFERVLNDLGDEIQRTFAKDMRDIERIISVIDALKASFDRFGPSVTDADLALGEAEQALATFATNTAGSMGEVDAAAQNLFQQVLEGKGSAELAAEAIQALGDANPDFAGLLGEIGVVIQQIYALRDAAVAATRVDVSGQPMSYAGQDGAPPPKLPPKTVSLSDYEAPRGGSSGGGGGGGGKSGANRYNQAVAAQEKEIAALQRKTQLLAQMNPLVNDYGYALERMNAQIELENAAQEAGLELSPQRRAQIEELASGYGHATAEAARLAEAQDKVRESADALAQAGRDALDSIIDGFLEGKEAGELFGDVLKDLGKNLLKMGINGFLGGLGGGGGAGSFLGSLFGGFREKGGSVQAGRAYVVGEKRPELFVPSQSGTIVPRLPSPAATGAQATGGVVVGDIVIQGNADAVTVSQLRQWSRFELPSIIRQHQSSSIPVNG